MNLYSQSLHFYDAQNSAKPEYGNKKKTGDGNSSECQNVPLFSMQEGAENNDWEGEEEEGGMSGNLKQTERGEQGGGEALPLRP